MATPPVLSPEVLRPRDSRPGRGPGGVAAVALGCITAVLVGRMATHEVTPVVPQIPTLALHTPDPSPEVEPIAAPAAATRRVGPELFELDIAPVIADGGLFVLLAPRVEATWLKGGAAPSMVDDEGLTVVTQPLGPRGRAAFATAIGARLRLFRADGSSCLTRVTDVVGLARLDDGGDLDQAKGARGAWKAAEGAHVVAGRLAPIEGRCDDARIARSDALPAPAIARAEKASDELARRVTPMLLGLPAVGAMFDSRDPADSPVEVVTFTAGGETIVQAAVFGEGCTGQEPLAVALWRLGAGDALELLGAEQGVSPAIMAAATGADGALELVVPEDILGSALLRRTGKRGQMQLRDVAPVAIIGCRC